MVQLQPNHTFWQQTEASTTHHRSMEKSTAKPLPKLRQHNHAILKEVYRKAKPARYALPGQPTTNLKTMEKDKEKYLEALRQNDGKLDERALGESLGFSKEYTDKIIEELMADEKIEYQTEGACSYRVVE
ncbi:hypothetical protein [Pontibacter ruber]|uniref:Uncharacterized protein n=1 Tax=Pontibacter ruber TaxID=1343895 RepID=A0ABW5CZE1_9BACT|nr:hypothetical protein [Pontibacter ruber]